MERAGITQSNIQSKYDSYRVGDPFFFNHVSGVVVAKHKHFCVVRKENGYNECFRWVELLIGE